LNVESEMTREGFRLFFLLCQQVKQQGSQAGLSQDRGDKPVARTVSAASRAMSEYHQAATLVRKVQSPFKPGIVQRYNDVTDCHSSPSLN